MYEIKPIDSSFFQVQGGVRSRRATACADRGEEKCRKQTIQNAAEAIESKMPKMRLFAQPLRTGVMKNENMGN